MQRKLSVRIIASLILSVMLFALPVGAFIANSSTAVSVYAEESVTGNEAGTTDDSSSSDDASDRGSTDEGTDTTVENPSSGDNSDIFVDSENLYTCSIKGEIKILSK